VREKATVILQRHFRGMLARRAKKQLESVSDNRLKMWRVLVLNETRMAFGVYEAFGAYVVKIFPVPKSSEPYRVYEQKYSPPLPSLFAELQRAMEICDRLSDRLSGLSLVKKKLSVDVESASNQLFDYLYFDNSQIKLY
jgi:hypothetical protein